MRVAIFDFDGTLYKNETFQLLMSHLKNHPKHKKEYNRFYRTILPPYIGYKLKLYPEDKMKERSMQIYLEAFANLSEDELNTYFAEVADQMFKDFNPLVVEQLKQHAEENVHIMLVSGAYTPLIEAATKHLPIDSIIGTDLRFQNKQLDLTMPIKHVQGERKTSKIKETLFGQTIDWENSYAYGDSYSDLPVLELVSNPTAVNPEPKLKAVADERNWAVI